MGTATSERSQAPARQGHFVVTTELPEIQTVTVWTPCCAPMSTLSYKKIRMDCLWCGLLGDCADVEGNKISDGTIPETGLYLLYIAIYMYNLMLYTAKNVWWEWKIIPYFATSTTRNASDGRLLSRVNNTRGLLIILWHPMVIDWLTNQSINWIPVKSLLIFSAIDSCLCVDGKCYRPYDRRLRPPMWSHGNSIDISPNWLYTCPINRPPNHLTAQLRD